MRQYLRYFSLGPAVLLLLGILPGPAAGMPAGPAAGSMAAPAPAEGRWAWPLSPRPHLVRIFDPPAERWLSGHRGVDLRSVDSSDPAHPGGVLVLAPAPGRVYFAGPVAGRPVISIDHGGGLLSSYEPVESTLTVGQPVQAGDPLGRLGGSGHCPGGCLHWGVRLNGEYINPLGFVLDLRPSVLLPVPTGPPGNRQPVAAGR